MKKIILFLFLITSLYSDAKTYFGLSYGLYDENFIDSSKAQSSSTIEKFKVGYGNRESYAIEFSLEHLKNESKIFSQNDSDKYGINIELIKAFDFNIYVNPFFKAGIGTDYLKIDKKVQNSLYYGSFNLGLGVFIPVNEYFDFILEYSYKSISYEAIDTIIEQISYKSNLNSVHLGFNVRF